MFSNTRNVGIFGGTFTEHQHHHASSLNIHSVKRSPIDRLMEASSLGALHNSGERFDPPKCHPNSRTAVLQRLVDWFIGTAGWDSFVLWLYGPAGAGKSAIAQTFAERCFATNGLLASFFFSRSDPKRNNERALVATLAYQIALRIPGIWTILEATIDRDPAIFQLNFGTQFETLILGPLLELSNTGLFTSFAPLPYLIIIDGLDECNGPHVQRAILNAISNAFQNHRLSLPFKFLIASRAEHHLTVPFAEAPLYNLTLQLALDASYRPNEDTRLFLIDSFRYIRKTHIMRVHLPDSWPSEEDIGKLVAKSSGQFIYAATVIRYVSSPRHNPLDRLKVIHGLLPGNNDTPFEQLDALYINILSGVEDIQTTLRVLGVSFVLPPNNITTVGEMEWFMLLPPGSIPLFILDLQSVVDASDRDQPLKFLHASFSDFLFDPTRSLQFHINPNRMHRETTRLCMAHVNLCLSTDAVFRAEIFVSPRSLRQALFFLGYHLQRSGPLHADFTLREDVLNLPYIQSLSALRSEFLDTAVHSGQLLAKFLSFLEKSNFRNTKELFLHHRGIWDQMMRNDLEMVPKSHGLAFWTAYLITVKDIPLVFFLQIVMAIPSSTEASGALTYVPRSFFNGAIHYHTLTLDGDQHLNCTTLDPDVCYYHIDLNYLSILRDFLTDPLRAGIYTADQSTYIMAAEFAVAFAVRPWDEKKKQIGGCAGQWDFIWDAFVCILSKAGHSNDIIKVLSRDDLTFSIGRPVQNIWERLRSMFEQSAAIY